MRRGFKPRAMPKGETAWSFPGTESRRGCCPRLDQLSHQREPTALVRADLASLWAQDKQGFRKNNLMSAVKMH